MSVFSSIWVIWLPVGLLISGLVAGSNWGGGLSRKMWLTTLTGTFALSFIPAWILYPFLVSAESFNWFGVQPLNLIMSGLVAFMAVMLIKFSLAYLSREQNANRYWRWLLLCLASVSTVIVSNNLLLFWLGWVAINLCFHRLLLFYPDRPRAILAAHKKFIFSRITECLLLIAIVMLYWEYGTFNIEIIMKLVADAGLTEGLTMTHTVIAILIALTALVKCAQLPLHGWLIQVVEAPTPISALLHAGIINMGGFLLMVFAPLFMLVPSAQWLILIVAGLTTVIAALVMATRISIKVKLAWSTTAQMGLMLVECAMGLYELALLHLVAHSFYKAYAFLGAGQVLVDHQVNQYISSKSTKPTVVISIALFAILLLAGITILSDYQGPLSLWLLLSLAFAMYVADAIQYPSNTRVWFAVLTLPVLGLLYVGAKSVFSQVTTMDWQVQALSAMDLWVGGLVMLLFIISMILKFWPTSSVAIFMSRWLFSGLYLDEIITRFTIQIWPIRLNINTTQDKSNLESLKFFLKENG